MPTISANTTQTITLAASTLMRGIGAAVLSWGTPLQTVTHTAGDEWHFGPFTAAQAVSIHAQSFLTYSTQAVSDDNPVDKLGLKFDGGLTAAQVQAVQTSADTDDSAIYGTPARTRWPIGVQQQALVCECVEASSTGWVYPQACAVVGVHAITLGTGTLTIHDDRTASDATRLRMSRAVAAMTAGSYYPMVADDGSALLFERGAFVTVPTGGLYLLDVVSDIRAYGIESGGLLCTAERLAASGRILGLSAVKSLKVIAPGSAGDLSVHEDHGATNAKRLRMPVTAFGSLAADQIINLAHRNCVRQFRNLYVTVPTSGIVLINRIPV